MTLFKRRAAWLLLSLPVFLVMLVLRAPAAVPARLIETLSAGRLQVVTSAGSAWNGSATLVATGLSAGHSERLAVTWQIDPARWYRAEVGWLIGTSGQSLRLALSPWRWELDSRGFSLPVAALRPFFPGSIANYGWYGQLQLSSNKFGRAWQGRDWDGTARIELQTLGVRELSVDPLGSFGLDLKPQGEALAFVMTTLAGPLRLDGRGSWREPRFSCEGDAGLAPGAAVEVGRLLDHLARRTGPGAWKFSCPA